MRTSQLRSTVRDNGTVELALVDTEIPEPADDQVVVRMEAAPIHPSTIGQMFGAGDPRTARVEGEGAARRTVVDIPADQVAATVGPPTGSTPLGNEGAGIVVAAGASESAQAMMGRTVAMYQSGTFSQLVLTKADTCLVLPEGVTPAQAASCFINPLTALGMVETMRLEGHTALVHTAAASSLGQMLVRVCLEDGIPLVNIVRRREQVDLLRDIGATYVCDSSAPDFAKQLTDMLIETDATIAFDAIGGGPLASEILTAMEAAQIRKPGSIPRYGSTIHKQVYVYGSLDRSPVTITRRFGVAWGVGGWLLSLFLHRVGREEAERLRQRVAAEITTTFASTYTGTLSLEDVLSPEVIARYTRVATGEKYLVTPNTPH